MKSEEEIRTVIKILEDYFEYPGVEEPVDESTAAAKYDMALVCDTLKWVISQQGLTSGMLDGLLELEAEFTEVTKSE